MPKKSLIQKDMVVYQTRSGSIELRGDYKKDTIWVTQAQIAVAFDVDVRTINEHIKNIYKSGELTEKSTIRNFRIVQKEGKREIEREVLHYNLDTILSVGYRVNNKRATLFRQWATKTLRAHIVDGYTINRSRISKNYELYRQAIEQIEKIAPESSLDIKATIELIRLFSDTWISLDAYDKSILPKTGATKKQVKLAVKDVTQALEELKTELLSKGEATDLFAMEKNVGSLQGIVGNVLQSFGGRDLYGTVEEKAAHILYFIVKDHPFNDGNKRSGAFAFIWYLRKANRLNTLRLTPEALTTLTLLVAESKPKDKDHVVGLILLLLN